MLGHLAEEFHGPLRVPAARPHRRARSVLALAGVARHGSSTCSSPQLAGAAARSASRLIHRVLVHKYYFDELNERVIAAGTRALGRVCSGASATRSLIDGALVNGSARDASGWFSGVARRVQSGYLYHYAFAMIIGLAALLGWLLARC